MKQVMISELKAHLSEVLRAVKAGETFVVRDRGVPVAQVVPYVEEDDFPVREATLPVSELLKIQPIDIGDPGAGLRALLANRDEEDR